MITCQFKCMHLNDLFSQEHADIHHHGRPSADNLKYHWEDELEVKNVKEVCFTENTEYNLMGTHPHSGPFSYPIPNVRTIKVLLENGEHAEFAISESLIYLLEHKRDGACISIHVELKDSEPFGNPITGVYIANKDFPAELTSHAKD